MGGDVFILKMRPLLVADLIAVLINALAKDFGHDPTDISIETIGLSEGEKLSEELITLDELACAQEYTDFYRIHVSGKPLDGHTLDAGSPIPVEPQPLLSMDEIKNLLITAGLVPR